MFKYNEWSDLKNSNSLVKPLSKTDDGKILCVNENGEECYYTFSDFDAKKKVEERTTSTVEEIIQSFEDDADNDGSENLEENNQENEKYQDTPEGFVYNPTMLKALNLKKGIFYKDNI